MVYYSDKINVLFEQPSQTDRFVEYKVEVYDPTSFSYKEIYRGKVFVFGGKDLLINLNNILENYKIDYSWLSETGTSQGTDIFYNYSVKVTLIIEGRPDMTKTINNIYPFYKYVNKDQKINNIPLLEYFNTSNDILYPRYPMSELAYGVDFTLFTNASNLTIISEGITKYNKDPKIGQLAYTTGMFNFEKNKIDLSQLIISQPENVNIYYFKIIGPAKTANTNMVIHTGGENYELFAENIGMFTRYQDGTMYYPLISTQLYDGKRKIVFSTKQVPDNYDPLYSTADNTYEGRILTVPYTSVSSKDILPGKGNDWGVTIDTLLGFNDFYHMFVFETVDDFITQFPYTLVNTLYSYQPNDEEKWNFIHKYTINGCTYVENSILNLNRPGISLIEKTETDNIFNINRYKILDFDICSARYYIKWVDREGGIQSQPFNAYNKYSEDIKYENIENEYREKRPSIINVNSKWELCTDYFDEKYYPVYESMLVSPYVVLYDTENNLRHNVIISDNSYEEKTFKNEKRLISFKITVSQVDEQNIIY